MSEPSVQHIYYYYYYTSTRTTTTSGLRHPCCHAMSQSLALPCRNSAAGRVVSEGFDPAWLQNLQSGPDMKFFNGKYALQRRALKERGDTSVKQVKKMMKDGKSIIAPRLACKCYERNDDQHLEKWASEVYIHSTLSGHPNIVQFHCAFLQVSRDVYRCNLVMELCRESLWEYMNHYKRLDWETVRYFGLDMCKGLQHIHQFSILHRDMKPGHCLVHHEGAERQVLKICDFGNSAYLTDSEQQRFPGVRPLAHRMTKC